MKLLIIRHGEPDYVHDALTPRGHTEAMLLASYLRNVPIDAAYVSPLGRARLTAQPTLDAKGLTATTLDWLQEFPPRVHHRAHGLLPGCAWDWYPTDWADDERFYGEYWYEHPAFAKAGVPEAYRTVCEGFDALLVSHGYRRRKRVYQVEYANHNTIALFCHFGLECVLLSRLMNISPMPLWHGTCAAPSSITTIYTEERERGIASFRMAEFGAVPHLTLAHQKSSSAARFAECYGDRGSTLTQV